MPFKSQAQRRLFYWAANNPSEASKKDINIDKKTVKEWESETPKNKKLPDKVKRAFRRRLLNG